MSQPDSFIQIGRLLYPRFLSKDGGISSGTPLPAYAMRDFPRIGFILLNETTTHLVFPVGEYPGDFPHGADAIVLGCRSKDYVTARLIAFPELNIVYTSAPLFEPCSP